MQSIYIKILLISAALILASYLGSCTRNDGDIGDLFGMWHVKTVEINGVQKTDYDNKTFFSFQNNVINVRYVIDDHTYNDTFGKFERNGSQFVMKFKIPENPPVKKIHFVTAGVNNGEIEKLNKKEFVLCFGNADGESVRLVMEKWN